MVEWRDVAILFSAIVGVIIVIILLIFAALALGRLKTQLLFLQNLHKEVGTDSGSSIQTHFTELRQANELVRKLAESNTAAQLVFVEHTRKYNEEAVHARAEMNATIRAIGLEQQQYQKYNELQAKIIEKQIAVTNNFIQTTGSKIDQIAAGEQMRQTIAHAPQLPPAIPPVGMEQTKTDVHVETVKPINTAVITAQEGLTQTQAGVEKIQEGIDQLKETK